MLNENDVINLLKQKAIFITAAESCTGGAFCSALVGVPGASEVFREGFVTYSDEAKHRTLGVRTETLEEFTAVSAQCAYEMAAGAKKLAGADIAVSITGYAGPEGAPAGLVYIGCILSVPGREDEIKVNKYQFRGDRDHVREAAVDEALKLVGDMLMS